MPFFVVRVIENSKPHGGTETRRILFMKPARNEGAHG